MPALRRAHGAARHDVSPAAAIDPGVCVVGQRRSEPGGNAGRRWIRSARLAVLLLGIAAGAGCDAGIRVVGFGTAGGGGGGGTGAGGGATGLVGTWRNLSSLALSSGETLILDVRWSFDAAGTCSRTRIQTIVSGNAGSETTETLPCTYTLSGSTVTVTFQGSSVPSRFSVAFVSGDLLLAGTRFTRIG
jgi:hypothetical protein